MLKYVADVVTIDLELSLMSTDVLPITEEKIFPEWYIDYYKTMASAATLWRALNHRASIVGLVYRFHLVSNDFKAILVTIGSIRDCSNEVLATIISQLEALHSTVDSTLQLATQRGYATKSLLTGSIRSIRKHNDELEDYIETFKLSLDPNLNSDIAAAIDQHHRGETVSLQSILRH